MLRMKYVAQPNSDDDKIESEDTSQFRVVSHALKSNLENIWDNVKDNVDLSGLKNIEFNKLSREEPNMVEESIYTMMAKFKTTPLELDNSIPKDLYSIIENKWHYCLNMEKEIRESTLAKVMPKLTKGQITKASKKHGRKFSPKYRAFNILQNNIEDVVNKSTKIWNLIYGLTIVKLGEEDSLEEKDNEEEKDNDKEEGGEKGTRERIVEET